MYYAMYIICDHLLFDSNYFVLPDIGKFLIPHSKLSNNNKMKSH